MPTLPAWPSAPLETGRPTRPRKAGAKAAVDAAAGGGAAVGGGGVTVPGVHGGEGHEAVVAHAHVEAGVVEVRALRQLLGLVLLL